MAFVWLTALKDLRRRLRDPLSLLLWLAIPLMMLILFSVTFGGPGETKTPQVHLLIADEDDSFGSRLLAGMFSQGELAELFLTEPVEREEGERRLGEGEASALLVIPNGFARAVIDGQETTLILLKNPSQRILPQIAEQVLSVTTDGVFYLQQLLGEPIRDLTDATNGGAPSDELVARFSVLVNQLVRRVEKHVFPPAIGLESERRAEETTEADTKVRKSVGALFFPGIVFMALIFASQSISDDIWAERDQGTLMRAVAAPRSVLAWLAGKALAGTLVLCGIALIALVGGVLAYDVNPLRVPLALVWAGVGCLVLSALFTLLQVFVPSQRAGNIIASVITFPLLMLGGSFFPFEAMPASLARIGRWTPNGWVLEVFKAILDGEASASAVALPGLALCALSLVAMLLAARRLGRIAGGG